MTSISHRSLRPSRRRACVSAPPVTATAWSRNSLWGVKSLSLNRNRTLKAFPSCVAGGSSKLAVRALPLPTARPPLPSAPSVKIQGRACLIARILSLVILNSISMANGSSGAGVVQHREVVMDHSEVIAQLIQLIVAHEKLPPQHLVGDRNNGVCTVRVQQDFLRHR